MKIVNTDERSKKKVLNKVIYQIRELKDSLGYRFLFPLINKFSSTLIKTLSRPRQVDSEFMQKGKETRLVKTILEKNKLNKSYYLILRLITKIQ